jgi:ADP-ribose pyrophosphatase YjhB (NUDIX family)
MTPMRRIYRVKEYDKRLPEKFYREHLLHFPVVTVDLVVTDKKSRFLLVKRSQNNLSWKAEWGTPGGRIFRNERVRDAAHRVLVRETGLNTPPEKFVFRMVRCE